MLSKNIATSNPSRYNPKCNGQVEKLNGTLWKAIQVTLHSRELKMSEWETVLPDALHSIRSLLCTTTNTTPHDRMFNFTRKSTSGKTIPSWVKPGPVYVKDHTRRSKNDPPVSPATLLHDNPMYAHVRLPSGVETTVNIRDLARQPGVEEIHTEPTQTLHQQQLDPVSFASQELCHESPPACTMPSAVEECVTPPEELATNPTSSPHVRRSSRVSRLPSKMDGYVMG